MLQPTMQRRLGTERQTIPLGTPLLELYRGSAGRKLLLLGQPGAGKTTLLLELLRDLLHEAHNNEQSHIPVYLNLSNWAVSEPDMVEWVGERLLAEYTIARKVSQQWLAEDRLALLLDGLDEVPLGRRGNCVEAINRLVAEHPMPLVICSRTIDYELLKKRLNLTQAVEIAPLEPPQIEAYLTDPRLQLGSVYVILQQDKALAELAQTPLMLSFMALAFRGQSEAGLWELLQSTNDRQQSLLNAFLVARLRDEERASPMEQQHNTATRLCWLRFLAQQLEQHGLQQYFIDEMQPSWLDKQGLHHYMQALEVIVVLGSGLCVGLCARLFFGWGVGAFFGLAAGILFGRFGGLISSMVKRVEITRWQRPTGHDVVKVLLLTGLQGSTLILAGSLVGIYGTIGGRIGAFVGTLIAWLVYGWLEDNLGIGLVTGLVIGLSIGLIGEVVFEPVKGLITGLIFGLVIGSREILDTVPSLKRTIPNQGVWMAGRLAIRVGLIFGLIIGLVAGLVFGLVFGLVAGLVGSVVVGGLNYGGREFIQHYLLRWMLGRQGVFPPVRQLIPFLDAMARRVLLVHAGAHYRFVHRTLQEHVAALSNADLMQLVAKIEG